jgi:SSS family solute:Na+ symporter
MCAALGVGLFYQSSNQVMMQRVLAARTTWDGLMGIIFAGFINFVRPLVTCFLGFIVYHWTHQMGRAEPLKDADTTFPFALTQFAPAWGLRGIILAGFLAAVMSTVSALANSTATIFALEIYRRIFRPNAADDSVVRTGQLASMLALLIAAAVCPAVSRFGGIFEYFQKGVTMLATPFISVFLLGILWKRSNYQGALFGLIGGIIIQIAVAVTAPTLGYKLHWFYTAAIAQAIIMTGIVIVSVVTAPPNRQEISQYVWSPALLKAHAEGIEQPWHKSVGLWFGIYAAGWIFLYWRFW